MSDLVAAKAKWLARIEKTPLGPTAGFEISTPPGEAPARPQAPSRPQSASESWSPRPAAQFAPDPDLDRTETGDIARSRRDEQRRRRAARSADGGGKPGRGRKPAAAADLALAEAGPLHARAARSTTTGASPTERSRGEPDNTSAQ